MIKTIGTHSGRFHCDEVMGVAILKTLFPDAVVTRTRDQIVLDAHDLVLDVGGSYDHEKMRYDHHQVGGASKYENGISYSSVGLIWKHYGHEYIKYLLPLVDDEKLEKLHLNMCEKIIMPVDAEDNGQSLFSLNEFDVEPVKLGDTVNWLNSPGLKSDVQDERFDEAVVMLQHLMEAKLENVLFTVESEQKFRDQYEKSPNKRYVVLDEYLPAGSLYEEFPELLFVLFPEAESVEWIAKTVRTDKASFDDRMSFPLSWRGLRGPELEAVSGVQGARFCHNAGFIAGATTKVGMVEMVEKCLERDG
jgi:uncharacterized UPF0160 family protein